MKMIKILASIFVFCHAGFGQNVSISPILATNFITIAPIAIGHICGRNEVWNQCADTCPETCEGRPTTPCILICRPGCDCLPGYVRHEGQCIQRSQCRHIPCRDPNAERKQCGSSICTCTDIRNIGTCPVGCPNPAVAPYKCFCKEGYIPAGPNGLCIPIEQCYPPCPRNAERKDCGTMCTCAEFRRTGDCPIACAAPFPHSHVGQCFCRDGYVRATSADGDCISQRECRTPQPDNCIDSNPRCSFWAAVGECNNNPGWMMWNCRKSCAPECTGGNAECVDNNTNCRAWANRGECERNPFYMNAECRLSCKRCGTGGVGIPG